MMNKRGWLAILFFLPALLYAGGIGQWRNYTSMKDVRAIARIGNSFWAATGGGLFRWTEGSETYSQLTYAEGLRSIDLTAVGVDATGAVWSGSSTGVLHVYDPSTGIVSPILDVFSSKEHTKKSINALRINGDTLLVCMDFGLSLYRISRREFGDTFTRFGTISAATSVIVTSAMFSSGRLWATLTDGSTVNMLASAAVGSNMLDPAAWTLVAIPNGATALSLEGWQGRVYTGTTKGLYVYTGGAGFVTVAASGSYISLALKDSSLYALSASGSVERIEVSNTTQSVATTAGFTPACLSFANNGSIAVGTLGNGIITSSGASWASHLPNGPGASSFSSVVVDGNGVVWAGSGSSNGQGLFRFDGRKWRTYTKSNSALPYNEVHRLSVDCDGRAWASIFGGGYAQLPRTDDSIRATDIFNTNVGMVGVPNNHTFVATSTMACDAHGNLWGSIVSAADYRILVVRRPSGAWKTLPLYQNGLVDAVFDQNEVDRSIAVDASDNIWLTGRSVGHKGVIRLSNAGTIDSVAGVFLTTSNGLPDDNITTIVADRENDIWVGTALGVAIIVDPANPTRSQSIAAYKPRDGENVTAIAVDPLNQKWVATSAGVSLWSSDGTQQLAFYSVENTDGKIIDNNIRGIAIDPKTGTVYFATPYGLSSLTTPAAQPVESFDRLLVYPNPYRLPNTVLLTVDGFEKDAWMKVLALDGTLVREVKTPGGRLAYWDGKDGNGNLVASGIYIIIGYTESGTETGKGKVAVVRQQ
jgi:ligand-binding sensor domain-containing protein